jgi:DNA-binding MarR family transcriptional regulator
VHNLGRSYVNMADIKYGTPRPAPSPLFLRDEELRQGVDLLVFALRDLNLDRDALLKSQGLGRAHGRALTIIARRPGLSVTDLLSLLRITKQSLNRVLSDLMAQDYVEQKPAPNDGRKRLLRVTEKGRAFDDALWEAQRPRVVKAFREAGPEGVAGFRKVLGALADTGRSGARGGPR